MDINNIIDEVNKIFRDVLDDENIVINRGTSSEDIEDWDSLNHMILVVEIEKFFKINFTAIEIQSYSDVGQMCDAILKKINL